MGTSTGSWFVSVMLVFKTWWSKKQFISKLKPDLSDYVYSTVFKVVQIRISSFLADRQ
jgi:hypothetical protein